VELAGNALGTVQLVDGAAPPCAMREHTPSHDAPEAREERTHAVDHVAVVQADRRSYRLVVRRTKVKASWV
jgi:hypothetical protein